MATERNSKLRAELQKLSERVAKDPLSTLFVPFAEELRKEGQIDRAIQVLRDGLRAHPHYVSARVSLGKILLEKGNLQEAKEEFERVVELAPENLLAQKRLGEIYRIQGRTSEAVRAYRAVLQLHPDDEESRQILNHLEQSFRDETPVEPAPAASALIQEEPTAPTAIGEEQPEEAGFLSVDLVPETGTLVRSHALESTYEIVPPMPAPQVEASEEKEETEAFSAVKEEPGESPAPAWPVGGEAVPPEEEGGILEPLAAEEAEIVPESETGSDVADFPPVSEEAVVPPAWPAVGEEPAPSPTPSEAETLVEQGHYAQALEAYRDLLARDPGNALYRQRVEELLAFSDLLMQGVSRTQPAREPAVAESIGARGSEHSAQRRERVIEQLETWLSHLRLRRAAS